MKAIVKAQGQAEFNCHRCQAEARREVNPVKPRCRKVPCHVSEIMVPEVELFVVLFFRLKSDLFKRAPFAFLERAGAADADLDVFALMDVAFHEAQEAAR